MMRSFSNYGMGEKQLVTWFLLVLFTAACVPTAAHPELADAEAGSGFAPYELMLSEADDLAALSGAAFAPLHHLVVMQETALLKCVGDPDFPSPGMPPCNRTSGVKCGRCPEAECSPQKSNLPRPVHNLVKLTAGTFGNGGYGWGFWNTSSCDRLEHLNPSFQRFFHLWSESAGHDNTLAESGFNVLLAGGEMLLEGRKGLTPPLEFGGFANGCFAPFFASAAFTYAHGQTLEIHSSDRCEQPQSQWLQGGLAILSLAWNVLKLEDIMPHPNPFGVSLRMVVAEQERWMVAYTECTSLQRTSFLASLIPVKYHLGEPRPAGQYSKEVPFLEPLEPDLNNFLQDEFGRFNPVAYRILPSFPSVRRALGRRRVLVDAGAGEFLGGSKVLLDMYSATAPFTEALLIDPKKSTDDDDWFMAPYLRDTNITRLRASLRVATGDPRNDLLLLIDSLGLSEEDFVVLKYDCDSPVSDATSLEWGFLADFVGSAPHLSLVDEIFVELHFFYPFMFGSSFHHHTMWQAFDLLRQLRECGIAVHAWP